jgi:predicted glycogen debranching enzyme
LKAVPGDLTRQLTLAADQFIVGRVIPNTSANEIAIVLKTVIAGYHWFTDWGRDAMISLPGLCLNTGRYEDAKKIIAVFARSVSMGMLPNRFQDNNEPPEYNNVMLLWYFNAIYSYLVGLTTEFHSERNSAGIENTWTGISRNTLPDSCTKGWFIICR